MFSKFLPFLSSAKKSSCNLEFIIFKIKVFWVIILTFFFTDNPLLCDCELHWFTVWLSNLREKDDEIMSKKRTVCTMLQEHREYLVQKMPLQKLGCIKSKNPERALSTSFAASTSYSPIFILSIASIILSKR